MLKRIAAAIIAAAMMISTIPVMADSYEGTMKPEMKFIELDAYRTQPAAELFAYEDDALYSKLAAQLENEHRDGEKYTVVVDGLESFGLDMTLKKTESQKEPTFSDDYIYLRDLCKDLVQLHNISNIEGKCDRDYILEKLTFEVDNSMSVDDIVDTITKSIPKELDDKDKEASELIIENLPIATVKKNLSEIVYKLQFENAKYVYIDFTRIGSGSGIGRYSQKNTTINFTTATVVSFNYLPITADEYKAFEKKLDDIVAEVICPDMTDVQKAMALHDWIIDNVKYGYSLDAAIYSSEPTTKSDVIFNIETFEELMDMFGGGSSFETMKTSRSYAHNAYAPAMKGYGVCQGYTMLYSLLLDRAGIENGVYISNEMDHQWSLVKIDGQWYHTDVTWDDPVPSLESDEYETITLSLSNGSVIKLHTQTEQNHNYSNFLVSEAECIALGHADDPNAISIPEVECNDNKFHAKQNVGGEETSDYVFGNIYYTKLNYSDSNKMYYYEQSVKVNGEAEVWYYKLPFVLKNADGTFVKPEQVTEEEFNAVIEGRDPGNDDNDDQGKHDDDYVTVQIPDETVIDNSVEVECKVDGEEGDGLTMENIGTSIVTITQKEETAEDELAEVDAYLVYYGENNTIIDIVVKTVAIDGSGEIQFDGVLPEGAVEAKIIILDADSELVPVIKALGAAAELPEEPAA